MRLPNGWFAMASFALLIGTAACGSDSSAPQTFDVHTTGDSISLAGGAVTIVVPPGAVSQDGQVTATPIDTTTVALNPLLVRGTMYRIEFTPATLQVLDTIRVKVTYALLTMPQGVRGPELRMAKLNGGVWGIIQSGNDSTNSIVIARVKSFSDFALQGLPAKTVTPSPASIPALQAGNNQTILATVRDSLGNTLPSRVVTFTSSDPTKASVDVTTGVVRGVAVGNATITLDAQTTTAQVPVTVSPGGGATVWYELNFESYANTSQLLADKGGSNTFTDEDEGTSQIFLDATVAAPGTGLTKSMRYDQANQTGNVGSATTGRCGSYSITRNVNLPVVVPEVWVESIERFSPGWTVVVPGAWGCSSAPGYKHFFGRINPGPRFAFGTEPGTWLADFPPGGIDVHANYSSSFDPGDGAWHTFRYHWKVSTTATSGDGVVQVWLDGTLRINQTGLNMHDGSGNRIVSIYGLSMGRNTNAGPAANQSIWWGRVRAYITNPGW